MDQEGSRNAGKTNAALVPAVDFNVGGVQDVLAEGNGIGASPTKQNDISSLPRRSVDYISKLMRATYVETSDQEFGPSVNEFKVVLLTTIAGKTGTELQVDSHT